MSVFTKVRQTSLGNVIFDVSFTNLNSSIATILPIRAHDTNQHESSDIRLRMVLTLLTGPIYIRQPDIYKHLVNSYLAFIKNCAAIYNH